MENILRDKMVAKARENGEKNGKVAELDFGAGAEWMHEQLSKKTKDIVKEIEEELRICSNYEYMNITIFNEHIKRFNSLLKKLQ